MHLLHVTVKTVLKLLVSECELLRYYRMIYFTRRKRAEQIHPWNQIMNENHLLEIEIHPRADFPED